jgi:hypothetical protein
MCLSVACPLFVGDRSRQYFLGIRFLSKWFLLAPQSQFNQDKFVTLTFCVPFRDVHASGGMRNMVKDFFLVGFNVAPSQNRSYGDFPDLLLGRRNSQCHWFNIYSLSIWHNQSGKPMRDYCTVLNSEQKVHSRLKLLNTDIAFSLKCVNVLTPTKKFDISCYRLCLKSLLLSIIFSQVT